jgi:hypothetical protein
MAVPMMAASSRSQSALAMSGDSKTGRSKLRILSGFMDGFIGKRLITLNGCSADEAQRNQGLIAMSHPDYGNPAFSRTTGNAWHLPKSPRSQSH